MAFEGLILWYSEAIEVVNSWRSVGEEIMKKQGFQRRQAIAVTLKRCQELEQGFSTFDFSTADIEEMQATSDGFFQRIDPLVERILGSGEKLIPAMMRELGEESPDFQRYGINATWVAVLSGAYKDAPIDESGQAIGIMNNLIDVTLSVRDFLRSRHMIED